MPRPGRSGRRRWPRAGELEFVLAGLRLLRSRLRPRQPPPAVQLRRADEAHSPQHARRHSPPGPGVTDDKMLAMLLDVRLDYGVTLDRQATYLSEGQHQRLALARILIDKSELVVLDEPISGVDIRTFDDSRQSQAWPQAPGRPHSRAHPSPAGVRRNGGARRRAGRSGARDQAGRAGAAAAGITCRAASMWESSAGAEQN